jgi:uncharacterized protein DUF6335
MAGASRRQSGQRAREARQRKRSRAGPRSGPQESATIVSGWLTERLEHSDTGPRLTGGDLDADWQRAADSGEEAVGGSVATPGQDVVDEIGEALGVPRSEDAPVFTSCEILEARRRHYWHLERQAADKDERDEAAP